MLSDISDSHEYPWNAQAGLVLAFVANPLTGFVSRMIQETVLFGIFV